MAFVGLGGAVNLGSAVGFLFIDGSGMRRGLNTAGGALDDFAKKSAASSQAAAQEAFKTAQASVDAQTTIAAARAATVEKIQKANLARQKRINAVTEQENKKVQAAQDAAAAATQRAQETRLLRDPKTQQNIVNLAAKSEAAIQHASNVITKGYQDRAKALQNLAGVSGSMTAKQIADANALTAALQKQAALQQKIADLNKRLAAQGVTPQQKIKLGGQKGRATQELGRVNVDIANLTASGAAVNAQRLASLEAVRKVAVQANKDEQAAIEKTTQAIDLQVREYKKLAAVAGPAAEKAATAIEKAGRSVNKAANDYHKLNEQIQKQQQIIATSKDERAVLAAQQKHTDLVLKRDAAYQKLLTTQRQLSDESAKFARIIGDTGQAALKAEAEASAASISQRIASQKRVADETKAALAVEQKAVAEASAAGVATVTAAEAKKTATVKAAVAERTAIEEAGIESQENLRLTAFQGLTRGALVATVALGGAVASTTAQFASFDEALHNIASISTDVNQVFTEFKQHLLDLSVDVAQSPQALAAALYDIVSSGVPAGEALRVLDASAKAAVAGLTDVAGAGKSLTAVINAYINASDDVKLTWSDVGKVADIAFAAVREGVFTFQELTQQQGDNLSIAAELGVSYEELAASYVVLTRRGNSLAESTTQINGIMRTFLKPNEKLAEALQIYGDEVLRVDDLTGAALIQQFGFGAALAFVSEMTKDNTAALGELFPNVRALRGEVGLGGKNLADYNHQLALMRAASEDGGAAQKAFNEQAKAVSFQLRQVREQVRVAAIEFGEKLAPGVLIAAKAVGAAASAFAALPDDVQTIIGGVTGFALAVSATVAVVGNLVGAVTEGARALKAMRKAMQDSAKAAAVLKLVMNPLTLLLVGASIAALKLWENHKKQKEAADDLKTAYRELSSTLDSLAQRTDVTAGEEAQLRTISATVNGIIALNDKWADQIENAVFETDALGNKTVKVATAWDAAGNAISFATLNMEEFLSFSEDFEFLTDEQRSQLLSDLNVILTKPGLDTEFVVQEILDLAAAYRTSADGASEFLAGVHDIATNIDSMTVESRRAKNALVEDGTALTNIAEFFGDAGKKGDELRQGLQALVKQTEVLSGAMFDLSSPLAFIQSAIGGVGDGVGTTLQRLDALGHISLDTPQQEAVDWLATLEKLDKQLAEVNQTISDSQQRSSQWAQTQQLVTDTVGTEADGFAGLTELAQRYGLEQEEVNSIREAAIFLTNKSIISIEDERLAQARALPDLAAFTEQHQLQSDAYDELTPEARGFADALRDTRTQAVILTALMLKLAAALAPGAFSDEFVVQFILDITQFDPEMAGVLDELGLIPEEVRSKIFIQNANGTKRVLEDIQHEIIQTQNEIGQLVQGDLSKLSKQDLERLDLLSERLRRLKQEAKNTVLDQIITGIPFLPDLSADVAGLTDQVDDLGQAWVDAFADAENVTKDLSMSVAQAIPGLLDAARGVDDFSDPMAFLQKHLGLIGPSFAQAALQGEQFGNLSFTPMEREALRAQANIDAMDEAIRQLDASMQQHADTIAEWTARSDQVDEILGTQDDALGFLNQSLQTNRINEQQYNDIVEAGTFIKQRSAEAVLDERAAMQLALIDEANFIKKHDDLAQSYDNLTSEQKGFLHAMQDQSVQMALNTFLMLKFLEVMGAVPAGTADKFLAIASAGNDALAAVVDLLGVVPTDPLAVDVQFTVPDPSVVQDDLEHVVPGQVAVDVVPETTTTAGGIPGIQDQSFAVTADTSQASQAVQDLLTTMRTAITTASDLGIQTGAFYDTGVEQGIIDNMGDVFATNQIFYDNWGQIALAAVRIFGPNVGQSFDVGVAQGVYGFRNVVANAGNYIGRLLFSSAMLAILARSPSKKGDIVGRSFVQGVTQGVMGEGAAAAQATRTVAQDMIAAFEDEMTATRALGMDVAGGMPNAVAARAAVPTGGRGGTGPTSLSFTLHELNVTVPDAGNPSATARAVGREGMAVIWEEFVGAINRLESQVVA